MMAKILSIIKKFIVFFSLKKNEESNIKYNFLFSLFVFFTIFGADFYLRLTGKKYFRIEYILMSLTLISCFIISFCHHICKTIIITFIFIPLAINTTWLDYSGKAMVAEEITKIFTQTDDIAESYSRINFILEIVLFIPYLSSLFICLKYRKKFYYSHFATLIILYGFYWIFKIAIIEKPRYAIPLETRMTIINTMRTFPYHLTHKKDKDENNYPQEVLNTYDIKLINKHSPRLVVVIWGESTQADYISFLGKTKFNSDINTTPKISKMIQNEKDNFISSKAISIATETQGSSTLFWNLLSTPTNFSQIAKSDNQNIFTLAKQNGYKTYWLSAFETNIMQTGAMPVDILISKNTHSYVKDRDDYLLNEIKKIDFSKGKHFVGIQFNSCHEVYEGNYLNHKEYEMLKPNNNDDRTTRIRKTYKNNLLYLDYLLSSVIEYMKKQGADVIFYTSDHGEAIGVDKNGIDDGQLFGHNILSLNINKVPFLLYKKKPDLKLKNEINNKKIITHSEIGKIIAKTIGFSIKNKNEKENEFYIFGIAPFSQSTTFKKYKRDNGKITEIYETTIRQYLNNFYSFNKH